MDFPEDYHAGHFVLIGPAGTGKPFYAKGRLAADPGLPAYVFVVDVSHKKQSSPPQG